MSEKKIDKGKSNMTTVLTKELPVLRARLGFSQEEIARAIGVTRQTYGYIETGKREMSWTIFLALIGFFQQYDKTAMMLDQIPYFIGDLKDVLKVPGEKSDIFDTRRK